ncbi:hypothetical protein BVI434_1370024 [Burkholderia vietnamiensis]|nr:hypothetical protein BVI434_1370024 [Burkholderia vietnamiensis]
MRPDWCNAHKVAGNDMNLSHCRSTKSGNKKNASYKRVRIYPYFPACAGGPSAAAHFPLLPTVIQSAACRSK